MYERDANRRQLAQNIEEQPLSKIHRHDARAPINCMICTSWRNNRDGSWTGSIAGVAYRYSSIPVPGKIISRDYNGQSGRVERRCRIFNRAGSLGYRVRSPSFRCNVITSADRAPRADLRGLGPCSLQIVAIKMI